jgi:hypothetical protein
MARIARRLAATTVDRAKAGRLKPGMYPDGDGLYLQVPKKDRELGHGRGCDNRELQHEPSGCEHDAGKLLRKRAMDRNQRVVEVARSPLPMAQLLKP